MRAWESVAKEGADIGFIPNQHSKKWRFCLSGISVVYSKPLSSREKRALVGKLGSGTSRFTSSLLLVILYSMNPRISLDPRICHGKPTIRGTRVLVSTLLGALAGGDSIEQIQQDYQIAKEDVVAALEFAREASDCQISIYEAVA